MAAVALSLRALARARAGACTARALHGHSGVHGQWWESARDSIVALSPPHPAGGPIVHLNNAGSSLPSQRVLDTVCAYLRDEASQGGYEVEAEFKARQESVGADPVYDQLATFLGCHPDEVSFQENATRAWTAAFYTAAQYLEAGDSIVVHKTDYASNYIAYLQAARRTGCRLVHTPSNEHGEVCVAGLRRVLETTPNVKLLSFVHCPSNGGLINPAAAIGGLAREYDVLYLLDACQSAGQIPLDVEALQCDALSATGRKYMRGPRGTGFLYTRKGSRLMEFEPASLDLHAATWVRPTEYQVEATSRRFETWERNWALWCGLGVAAQELCELGMPRIEQRVQSLARTLRDRLAALPGCRVMDIGDPERRSGIVTFDCPGLSPTLIRDVLHTQHGINVSVVGRANTLLDMTERGADALVRASLHFFNTDAEIEALCTALDSIVTSE